ncbi:MAG: SemiSWEET family sugar transporter [Leptospirillum sp.]|jgi:MtN3 and saliva related transmembrane protein|nr:SemiSWEET transporter [Nitrospiraceae bacterium]
MNRNHWIGIIAGILTTGAFLPQVAQILKTRNTRSISLAMYLLSSMGVAIWIFYGLKIRAPPIIIFNIINLVLMLLIIGAKLYWK